MKIYHTETQADYDALMVELEAEGAIWSFGRKLSESNNWYVSEHLTCIRVYDSKVNHASLNYYKEEYPDTPITKYKAKVDEKMKFTKENVEKVIDEYFRQADLEPCGDLITEIYSLDDTPEKVAVPKCFDDWYSEIKNRFVSKKSSQKYALWKINQFGFGYWLQDVNGENIDKEAEVSKWVSSNTMIAVDAVLNGYEVEKEPLYHVKFPNITNGGFSMFLFKNLDGKIEIADNADYERMRFTEAEIKEIDERYWPFAVPVKDKSIKSSPAKLLDELGVDFK